MTAGCERVWDVPGEGAEGGDTAESAQGRHHRGVIGSLAVHVPAERRRKEQSSDSRGFQRLRPPAQRRMASTAGRASASRDGKAAERPGQETVGTQPGGQERCGRRTQARGAYRVGRVHIRKRGEAAAEGVWMGKGTTA